MALCEEEYPTPNCFHACDFGHSKFIPLPSPKWVQVCKIVSAFSLWNKKRVWKPCILAYLPWHMFVWSYVTYVWSILNPLDSVSLIYDASWLSFSHQSHVTCNEYTSEGFYFNGHSGRAVTNVSLVSLKAPQPRQINIQHSFIIMFFWYIQTRCLSFCHAIHFFKEGTTVDWNALNVFLYSVGQAITTTLPDTDEFKNK